jgi:serine/threonine-protein kinase HipA
MRKVRILVGGKNAGILEELNENRYLFTYQPDYNGQPASLTMPTQKKAYEFSSFPPFLEGLLPEGIMLEALLRQSKLDKNDLLGQLLAVGKDVVGAVTIEEMT